MSRIPFVGSVIHRKMAIFGGCVEKGGKLMLWYEKSIIVRLLGMFMRTWDYRGFAIEPVLAILRHIFDQKKTRFFWKNDFFWFCDKLADSADIHEKMLGKVGYNQFWPESII